MKDTARPQTRTSGFRYWAMGQLMLARLREFYREPEAVFWVYGFPLLMIVALGIAFRNQRVERVAVDVQEGPGAAAVAEILRANDKFDVKLSDAETTRRRIRVGHTDVVVIVDPSAAALAPADAAATESTSAADSTPASTSSTAAADSTQPVKYLYWYDPARAGSVVARDEVNEALQRAAGRTDPAATAEREMEEPGSRYIDFLVPGLLGLSLMGGGMWGVGFVTVDMRIRKLLKRMLATPMRKRDFLLGIILSRLIFMVPEVLVLLIFARITFGVVNQGSLLAVLVLVLLGALAFAGLGLLIASRAKTVEAVSGLMNLVMLPMWILSGAFFSSDRFPEAAQPFIKALPLTEVIDALRGVMLEGASLANYWPQVGALAAWGVVTFILALKLFRWN